MNKVLKFSASWCLPCKALSQVIKSNPPEVEVEELDVDTAVEQRKAFDIRSVPTLVFLKNGVEAGRITGSIGAGRLKQFIDSYN